MSNEIVVGLIAAIPTTATAISTVYLNSQRKKDRDEAKRVAERNSAKASIQNMITQDIIRTEILGKLPENREAIENEYTIYHKNGGNGTITRQFTEYTDWYHSKQAGLTKGQKRAKK